MSHSLTGVLCGECNNSSYGVTALLNRCVTCHDAMSILIALLSEQRHVLSIIMHTEHQQLLVMLQSVSYW